MLNPENHLKNATRVMRLVGWLCFAGLPLFALLYPPGVLWGEVHPDHGFPSIGPAHPPSPHDGLHPYFYMVAAMYVSYGFLMIIGARKPQRNVALFDYGIAANLLHGGIMIPMAFYYPNEHAHMWFDIPFAFLVAALCYVWHPDRLQAGITRSLFWWIPFGSVADIPAEKLDSLRLGGAEPQILDVRTALEWRASHIPGAINVPITEFGSRLESLNLDRNRPIIAICLTAHRSIPAVRTLRELGFPNACQLHGGMLAWWKAQLPVASAGDGNEDSSR